MDEIVRRIQEKLLQRGNAERQRAEEWQRSLKPTIYRGNNLFQELGGEPLEGRYLGQVGLVPGQSVPNIGRNPNKPVIPGLPLPSQIVEPEEGGLIRQQKDVYSAIFTREIPGGRTSFIELEMLQRTAFNNILDWEWDISLIQGRRLACSMNNREFYYWNGSSIQKLFTYEPSTLISSGTSVYDNNTITIYSMDKPGALENGSVDISTSINVYQTTYYYVVYTQPTTNSKVTLNSTDYTQRSLAGYYYAECFITNLSAAPSTFIFELNYSGAGAGTVDWEIHKINTHGSYFTTTSEGTAFAHLTNGNVGDGKEKIQYFYASGNQPLTLQKDSILDASVYDFPDYDWRSTWLSLDTVSTSSAFNLFYGMQDNSIQFEKIRIGTAGVGDLGYRFALSQSQSSNTDFLKYVFQGIGTVQDYANNGLLSVVGVFLNTRNITTSETETNQLSLPWHRIDLSSIAEEWEIVDICTTDYTSANVVANPQWYMPMLAIHPYNRTIFF